MSRIINIRGTGGAGKSHLVREVMGEYPNSSTLSRGESKTGRARRPLGYFLWGFPPIRPLFVPGHYETACGGCDTIKTVDEVYDLINRHRMGVDGKSSETSVLYEGIMVMDDVRRAVELSKQPGVRYTVIGLTTDIEECLAAIRARRLEAGNEEPLSEKNTRNRAETLKRNLFRLKDAGVEVLKLSRQEALSYVRRELGLAA